MNWDQFISWLNQSGGTLNIKGKDKVIPCAIARQKGYSCVEKHVCHSPNSCQVTRHVSGLVTSISSSAEGLCTQNRGDGPNAPIGGAQS